jgi:hypothetical protein
MNIQNYKKYDGYISLLSVILISVVGISITTTLLIVTSSINNSYRTTRDATKAQYAAESCIEHALEELQQDNGYLSGESLIMEDSECEIVEILGDGNTNREIRSEGKSGTSTKRYTVILHHIAPSIEITQWKEVSDF